MKTLLISIPSRRGGSTFPPYACLALARHLRKNGMADVSLYDLDTPDDMTELLALLEREQPRVVGLSAVVSTTYATVKKLSFEVRGLLPEALIVLGGNLAASADVLLHRTAVDLCVLGEGENPMLDILRRAETATTPLDYADIRGVALLDRDGNMLANGYGRSVPRDEMYDVDWGDLERLGLIDKYMPVVFRDTDIPPWPWEKDARSYEARRRDRRHANIYVGKGCPNRCTFCHRWTPGVRYIPVPVLERRIRELVERYDVGFISLMVEAFGVNKRWLKDFCEAVKPLDVLWCVGGVRADTLTPDEVAMMKDSGCAMLTYGHESGSQKMLDVMEKHVELRHNYESARHTIGNGLNTVIQTVIGMPGENNRTISETIRFARYAASLAPWQRPAFVSVNYALALPGTPIYEYGRRKGLFGKNMDDEEAYLLHASNVEAADESMAVNFTDASRLDWLSWRDLIFHYVFRDYVLRFGIQHYETIKAMQTGEIPLDHRYVNDPQRWNAQDAARLLKKDYSGSVAPRWKNRLRAVRFYHFLLPRPVIRLRIQFRILKQETNAHGWQSALNMVKEHIGTKIRNFKQLAKRHADCSLRQTVDELPPVPCDSPAMAPLRKGR
ncbi:B12-binding domain-containing radical SAM protein [Salidesulfovibrio brasiliensis]|uniref:B12-binding domain-containing radical SAM protein n=1 Tax=Salidesulfovibrio brasiliensis TaxID=221711 RepID=UPI0006D23625|nr:radical SAM protein [Salidesulfovibrio brasiliensis]